MDIQVALDTQGAATAGVDRDALIADLQAELDKLAAKVSIAAPIPTKKAPPEGAQGDAALIHWLLHVAREPAMAKAYAQALVMAINAIVSAASKPRGDNKGGTGQNEKKPLKITVLNKDLWLPVATSVIKSFFDNSGSDGSGS